MVVFATLVGLVSAACSNGSTSTAPPGGKPIVIGISLSSSGDFSDPSSAAKKGYDLWAETVNALGGRLVVADIAAHDGSPRHDAARLATTYASM